MKVRSRLAEIPRAADWRCPACDYPFRGRLESYDEKRDALRCPECGREWPIPALLIEHNVLDKPTPWWWYGLAAGLPAGWVLVLCAVGLMAGGNPTDIRFEQEMLLLVTLPVNIWLGCWHASRAGSLLTRLMRAGIYFILAYIIGILSSVLTFIAVAILTAPFAP